MGCPVQNKAFFQASHQDLLWHRYISGISGPPAFQWPCHILPGDTIQHSAASKSEPLLPCHPAVSLHTGEVSLQHWIFLAKCQPDSCLSETFSQTTHRHHCQLCLHFSSTLSVPIKAQQKATAQGSCQNISWQISDFWGDWVSESYLLRLHTAFHSSTHHCHHLGHLALISGPWRNKPLKSDTSFYIAALEGFVYGIDQSKHENVLLEFRAQMKSFL